MTTKQKHRPQNEQTTTDEVPTERSESAVDALNETDELLDSIDDILEEDLDERFKAVAKAIFGDYWIYPCGC